jgi:hypothetical protein
MNEISTIVANAIPEHAMEIIKQGEETEAERETRRSMSVLMAIIHGTRA